LSGHELAPGSLEAGDLSSSRSVGQSENLLLSRLRLIEVVEAGRVKSDWDSEYRR
jgi:hypothetical protein